MSGETKKVKGAVAQEKIFRVMMIMTYCVAAAFLLKNVIGATWGGAIAVGICMVVFSVITLIFRKLNVSQYVKQFALCIELPLLVFFISIFSGDFYSDDFPLFLAVVGLAGMYLEPVYTKAQMVEIPILLLLLYVIHPDKADPFSQYIMCVILLIIASFTFCLAITRGRAFIQISQEKAEEAEKLLASIKKVGEELRENYEVSSGRIDGMREVNERLEENTAELKNGSYEINDGTHEVENSCDEVQKYMQITASHIDELNQEVKQVENAMAASKENMQVMDTQMQSVKKTVGATKEVFTQLQQQIKEISEVTNQLTSIAANTKMLALNASIEAARAGESGAGFAVVASQVQSLALDSNNCSNQVISVVDNMKNQIEVTTGQLEESVEAIDGSLESLVGLESGFGELISTFDSLYDNIEEQNKNVKNVDSIFGNLRDQVGEMSTHSEENQAAVESIVESMTAYKEHMNKIIEDARTINKLSVSMLNISEDEAAVAQI